MRWCGVGVRSTVDLAPSAFLSSIHSSLSTIQQLLPLWVLQSPDPALDEAVTRWMTLGGLTVPSGSDGFKQKTWDDGICSAKAARLLEGADTVGRARLLASVAPSSGSWIMALPCANLGLRAPHSHWPASGNTSCPCS